MTTTKIPAKPVSRHEIETLVREMVFGPQPQEKLGLIRQMGDAGGLYFASIQNLYEAIGKGQYQGFTVPAMNLRGLTFDVARAVFKAAIKNKVGPFVFELARSEMGYTKQSPAEFACAVMAAGLVEGYKGPLFIQADHTQFNRKNYQTDPKKELDAIKALVKEAVEAGFYNIDIDASTGRCGKTRSH
jgi:fructose/tagatose bisphosphate aldolase